MLARDVYLGSYGSPGSRQAYDRVVAEWLANSRRDPALGQRALSVNELIVAYRKHAEGYYLDRGGQLGSRSLNRARDHIRC